jgi:carbon-monoxide dehydrogenase medium subunit
MYKTKYKKAGSIKKAVKRMKKADDGKYLGGGMTLIPTMKQRLAAPSHLIDLTSIGDLAGISFKGGTVRIGAATTHADVATNADIKSACGALSALASHIGDPQVRNRGTIGGSIANNDPAADYPAAMMALGANIVTNNRTIAAGDFFNGLFETTLEDDEIIVAVEFEAPAKAAYKKFPNPASRYAMAGVFVAQGSDGSVRVGVTGAGADGVFRHGEMEKALAGNWSADAIDGCSVDASDLLSDIHGNAEYRANLVKVMAKRAVAAA